MKKIRILIIDQEIGFPIRDGMIKEIKYNEKDTVDDVINRIDYQIDSGQCCLDMNYERYLFSAYSHSIGIINWKNNVYKLKISRIVKCINNNFLLLNCNGGTGSTGGEPLFDIFLGVLSNFIFWFCSKLFSIIVTKNGAIRILEEVTNEEFVNIKQIINYYDEWEYGFICNYKFKQKAKVEKVIMKSLGYELKNNYWVR